MKSGQLIASIGVIALCASGCGAGGSNPPEAEGGSRRAVVKKIDQAESTRDWGTWQEFCGLALRVRAVRRPIAAGLVLDRSSVRSGGRAFARIENRGTAALAYGSEPQFDQLVSGMWHPRRVVREGHRVGFSLQLAELKARKVSGCLEIPMSDTWNPGLYRVRVAVEGWDDRGSGETVAPAAYFRVRSPQSGK